MIPGYAPTVRIGIMGAGSIGCYVGGKLLAHGAVEQVVFVGRQRLADELASHGLRVKDFDEPAREVAAGDLEFATSVEALADCDAVLVCVKSAQTEGVGRELAEVLSPSCTVASFQNGMRNPVILREAGIARVVPSVVGFNVVSRGKGLFHRAMSGPLMLQADAQDALPLALKRGAHEVETHDDLAPHQWTKLIVNLNNAVSALSGAPTRALLLSPTFRRIIAAVVGEAVAVLRVAKIKPASLRGVPIGFMPRVLRLPTPIVRLVTRAQMRVDPEARSSMWEDLTRKRTTEVDFLNGEVVRLADQVGAQAPINRRIVELVHEAEAAAAGPPNIDAEALVRALGVG
jgi:2-dehydropantoate 2-reductase